MTAYSMGASEALAVVADIASRWGENYEEQFPRRIDASDTDEALRDLAKGDEDELEEMRTLRDLWRALETVQSIINQKGCEHFSDCGDGKLTTLIDTVVFG